VTDAMRSVSTPALLSLAEVSEMAFRGLKPPQLTSPVLFVVEPEESDPHELGALAVYLDPAGVKITFVGVPEWQWEGGWRELRWVIARISESWREYEREKRNEALLVERGLHRHFKDPRNSPVVRRLLEQVAQRLTRVALDLDRGEAADAPELAAAALRTEAAWLTERQKPRAGGEGRE